MAHKQFLKEVPDEEFQEQSELSQYYLDRFNLFIRLEKDSTHLYIDIMVYIKDKT